jgi:type VI secretion system protein ImpH
MSGSISASMDAIILSAFAKALRETARRRSEDGLHPGSIERLKAEMVKARTPRDAGDFSTAEQVMTYMEYCRLPETMPSQNPDDVERVAKTEQEGADRSAQNSGFFAVLRKLEREAGRQNKDQRRPRIGCNRRRTDRIVALGQDPVINTLGGDLSAVDFETIDTDGTPKLPRVRAQFLGFFGSFGALPLNWTEEIVSWVARGDRAFVDFADLFTARFQELFYRAWSAARPVTQFDHPDDRFEYWLLSLLGSEAPSRETVSNNVLAGLTGLAGAHVKSSQRLLQILQQHFGNRVEIDVEELVQNWLDFEPEAYNAIGLNAATLGRDMFIGTRTLSVAERIRLHIRLDTLNDYYAFLPGAQLHDQLRDLTFWYIGYAYDVEVWLWLPHTEISPSVLGRTAKLGWMACIAPVPGRANRLVNATKFELKRIDRASSNARHAA